MNEEIAVYIHIPFCQSKCYYCDFTSYVNCDLKIEEYIDALILEILQNSEILSTRKIKSIYFGGGTPSYIDPKYIERILDVLRMFLSEDAEITIEVNPNSLTFEKVEIYKRSGINRISIGLQSTYDEILKSIGRKHTYSDFLKALEDCKNGGIKNISLDLIYPLPYLTLDKFSVTLDKVINLSKNYDIKHISIYNLEIHENTKLEFLLKEGFYNLVSEDEEYEMKCMLEDKLQNAFFYKYEISNFAKKGYESKHNLTYWYQQEYLGFGVAAASFFCGTRYKNTNNIDEYINGINNGNNILIEKEELNKLDLEKEYIILNLRLIDGINISKFRQKFNTNLFDIFKEELTYLFKTKLIEYKNNKQNIALTKRGMEVANLVWEKFI